MNKTKTISMDYAFYRDELKQEFETGISVGHMEVVNYLKGNFREESMTDTCWKADIIKLVNQLRMNSHEQEEQAAWLIIQEWTKDKIMLLKLEMKSSYGRKRYYPANELSLVILSLMHKKSFTPEQVSVLRDSGFRVECGQLLPRIDFSWF